MKRMIPALVIALLAGVAARCFGGENVLVKLENFHRNQVKFEGFVLAEPENVSISVVASSRERPVWSRAWILNSETREVVWDVRRAASESHDRSSSTYTDNVQLPAGTYEVYYGAFPYTFFNINGFSDLMDFLGDKVFHWDDNEDYAGNYRDLSMTVEGKGTHLDKDAVDKLHNEYRKNSLFSMSGLWDNQSEHQAFVLDKPTDLDIYALGEVRSDGAYDYGWIKDVKSGRIVWTMTNRELKRAGGDRKNRMDRETISLPAGTYAAYFVTDDSHSTAEWNAPPPYDPEFWGLTVRVSNPASKGYAHLCAYEDVAPRNAIVEITKVRDKEFKSKGFSLKHGIDVRILAIGEGDDGTMYDYGWLLDARSNKKVWEMKYRDTDHAGGASKNRMIDTVIHLPEGDYVATYTSDGTHNYGDWNAAPPYDPEHWGISIYGANDKFASADIAPFDENHSKGIIASIVRVGDDERKHKSFTITKDSEVRIYALGEGVDDEMVDYGWIEDAATGRTVWEMTYRMTEPAGGAQKNRRFDGTILLRAGEYVVHFRTDDSHSFDGWNDDPPPDPYNWGITVYSTDSKMTEN
ncbi:MAG TPA: hypothetical protein VMG34_02850 [Bacteroidota bacterium]|nr:hypothetical protein [Bacteroidota bacterium]